MLRRAFCWLLVGVAVALVGVNATLTSQPEGQLTLAFDTTIAPTYLDPAEMTGIAEPLVFLYALHDALVKTLPGNHMPPCLAESWTESADGLVYEFKLLHEQVKAIEIIEALFQQQEEECDRTKREALLKQMQRLMLQRVMHAPIAEPVALHGMEPRAEEPGIGLIPLFAYFGPYEEMRLKRP
jgi:hypothetical protein